MPNVTKAKVKGLLHVETEDHDSDIDNWIDNIAQEVADSTGKTSISAGDCTQGEENAITLGCAVLLAGAIKMGDTAAMGVSIEGVSYSPGDPAIMQFYNWKYRTAVKRLPKSITNRYYISGVS